MNPVILMRPSKPIASSKDRYYVFEAVKRVKLNTVTVSNDTTVNTDPAKARVRKGESLNSDGVIDNSSTYHNCDEVMHAYLGYPATWRWNRPEVIPQGWFFEIFIENTGTDYSAYSLEHSGGLMLREVVEV